VLEIANLSLLSQLQRATFARRTVCYIAASQVWTCPADGWLVIRCLGAGGGGGACVTESGAAATGGSAGTVGVKRVRVARGAQFTFIIPAGGARAAANTAHGGTGGTLTVTGPGVAISIPGGPGGKAARNGAAAQNDDAADPTGLDWFIKSARNTAPSNKVTGGAAPALLVGGQSHASNSDAGASVSGGNTQRTVMGSISGQSNDVPALPLDASHCWLLVDVSGALVSKDNDGRVVWRSGQGGLSGPGGFGGGGGTRTNVAAHGIFAGNGGVGAGGGAMSTGSGYSSGSGEGGPGFVTLELLEAQP
jgi:hypothetical protein